MSPRTATAIAKLETVEDDLRRTVENLTDLTVREGMGWSALAHASNAYQFLEAAMADLRPAPRPLLPLAERVLAKTRRDPSGCHIWIGAMSAKRNGRRPVIQEGRRGSKVISVARWACEQQHGPAPTPEHEAGHTCPNGEREDCVNPEHLRWVTRTENERMKRRGTDDGGTYYDNHVDGRG